MKHIEVTKSQLNQLIDDINVSSGSELHFHQQDKIKEHMSIIGGNGRLCICPTSDGYDISLSGKSLTNQMHGFMKELCQKECDGYKQKNANLGKLDQPFWRVTDFNLVRKAAEHYAKIGK